MHHDEPAGAERVAHHDTKLGDDLVALRLLEDGDALDRDQCASRDMPRLEDRPARATAQLLQHLEVSKRVDFQTRGFVDRRELLRASMVGRMCICGAR